MVGWKGDWMALQSARHLAVQMVLRKAVQSALTMGPLRAGT